jgi:hypothetical protein
MIPSKIPFRLTIGVTGHRTFFDQPSLRETIQRVLDEIKYTHTYDGLTEFTWCILTPLAEGADRIVAEEILKRPEGSALKVVLPLAIADYLEDFGTPQSKEEFHQLLAKDRSPISLKKLPLQDEYPPEMIADARRDAYEQGGKFVVDHCDILIALWDGKESRGQGSTAEIVRYAEEQKCPRYIISTVDLQTYTFIDGNSS